MRNIPPRGPGLGRRVAAALAVLGALLLLAFSFHHVPSTEDRFCIRRWSIGGKASVLSPGWRLAPPLVSHVAFYPARPVPVHARIGLRDHTGGLKSREGAATFAAGTLQLRANPDRPIDLSRAFPEGLGKESEQKILTAFAAPLLRFTSARSFRDLMPREGPAASGMPREIAEEIARMGLIVESSSALKFYPLPSAREASLNRTTPGAHRVLLIGLDGADWDILDPLMRKGRMPRLERLVESGVRARLRTITPVLSPIIWTSIATGVGPSRHGIVDFLASSKTTGQQMPVTSNMRRVKALWNILSEHGRSSGVVAWWATWPAEQIEGFIVSDRVAYQLFGFKDEGEGLRKRTYPEALGLVIHPLIISPSEITDSDVERFMNVADAKDGGVPGLEDNMRSLKTIMASARTYFSIGNDLLSAYDPDFKAIYFEGTDTVAHNFMRYRRPAMPGVTDAEVAVYGDVVDRYYESRDERLEALLSLADENTVVIICSDHGFRTGSNRPTTDPRIGVGGAADWHRKFGILIMAGPGVRRGVTIEDASVLDIAPTVLAVMGLPVAQDMEGRALTEAFDPPLHTQTIATYETAGGGESAEPVGSALDSEIIAKLTALGYVSQEGTNAMNNTGITLLERGRYSEAADAFRRALAQDPAFIHGRINLGRAQMLMKDFAGAIATFGEVLRSDPSHAEVHNLLGNIYMNQGDLKKAEQHFTRAIAAQPNDTHVHNSLGLLYEKLGKDDRALDEYRKVVAVDPDYAEGYNNMGLIYRKEGDPRKAIELFDQAIQADAEFAGSYNNMGLAYQDLGQTASARDAFDRGLKVDPDNAVILNNLGTVDLAEKKLEDAKSRFEMSIKADPEYTSAYNNLGAVLGMLGRPDEAFEQYLKAVDLDPAYTDARFNLGRHLITAGKSREGIEMLEKVLQIDPHYGKAALQIAVVLAQQGETEAALRQATRAAAEIRASPDPHNLLADLYLRLNRRDEALRELKRSLALDSSQPRVVETIQKLEAAGS